MNILKKLMEMCKVILGATPKPEIVELKDIKLHPNVFFNIVKKHNDYRSYMDKVKAMELALEFEFGFVDDDCTILMCTDKQLFALMLYLGYDPANPPTHNQIPPARKPHEADKTHEI